MKIKIRRLVFETNSSSVHTLQISKEGMEPSELKIRKKDKKIRVPLRYWGKEHHLYTSQLDKLSYICTRAWCANNTYYRGMDLKEEVLNYVLGQIEEAICHYTGASGIELYIPRGEEPGFDHQTIPDYSDDMNGFCNVWNEDSVQTFVFNKYISFTTDCD